MTTFTWSQDTWSQDTWAEGSSGPLVLTEQHPTALYGMPYGEFSGKGLETGTLQGRSQTGSQSQGMMTAEGSLNGISLTGSQSAGTMAGAGELAGQSQTGSQSTGTLKGNLTGRSTTGSQSQGVLSADGMMTGISRTGSQSSGTLAGAGELSGASQTGSQSYGALEAGALFGVSRTGSQSRGTLTSPDVGPERGPTGGWLQRPRRKRKAIYPKPAAVPVEALPLFEPPPSRPGVPVVQSVQAPAPAMAPATMDEGEAAVLAILLSMME